MSGEGTTKTDNLLFDESLGVLIVPTDRLPARPIQHTMPSAVAKDERPDSFLPFPLTAAEIAKRRLLLASLTIENYIKTIHELCARQQGQPAATGQIAVALGVSPGSVTSMLKTLSDSGMVTYMPYEGVRLTESGRALARRVLRRHRLIELFLVETLNLNWDEVHDEAENMEHAVSDLLIDRIDEFLKFPETDPHGDPIPQADGSLPAAQGQSLASIPLGTAFRLIRVLDQDPKFLRYLSEVGLPLGATGHVVANRQESGAITVAVEQVEFTVGRDAAEKLMVETENSTAISDSNQQP